MATSISRFRRKSKGTLDQSRGSIVARMRKHLEAVTHDSDFDVWDDKRIRPGDKWKEEIDKAIRGAKVAILVLTADFCASSFIRDSELPLIIEAAEAAGTRILCIYGSSVRLEGRAARLTQYQFVNSLDRPLQALSEAEREALYASLAGTVHQSMSQSSEGVA